MTGLEQKLNRLCKWRSVFAGWQLGTRADTDAECRAVRDHREVTMLLRAELNAMTKVLIDRGVITIEELERALGEEADKLSADYEKKFPGFKATDAGISINVQQAAQTTKGWRP